MEDADFNKKVWVEVTSSDWGDISLPGAKKEAAQVILPKENEGGNMDWQKLLFDDADDIVKVTGIEKVEAVKIAGVHLMNERQISSDLEALMGDYLNEGVREIVLNKIREYRKKEGLVINRDEDELTREFPDIKKAKVRNELSEIDLADSSKVKIILRNAYKSDSAKIEDISNKLYKLVTDKVEFDTEQKGKAAGSLESLKVTIIPPDVQEMEESKSGKVTNSEARKSKSLEGLFADVRDRITKETDVTFELDENLLKEMLPLVFDELQNGGLMSRTPIHETKNVILTTGLVDEKEADKRKINVQAEFNDGSKIGFGLVNRADEIVAKDLEMALSSSDWYPETQKEIGTSFDYNCQQVLEKEIGIGFLDYNTMRFLVTENGIQVHLVMNELLEPVKSDEIDWLNNLDTLPESPASPTSTDDTFAWLEDLSAKHSTPDSATDIPSWLHETSKAVGVEELSQPKPASAVSAPEGLRSDLKASVQSETFIPMDDQKRSETMLNWPETKTLIPDVEIGDPFNSALLYDRLSEVLKEKGGGRLRLNETNSAQLITEILMETKDTMMGLQADIKSAEVALNGPFGAMRIAAKSGIWNVEFNLKMKSEDSFYHERSNQISHNLKVDQVEANPKRIFFKDLQKQAEFALGSFSLEREIKYSVSRKFEERGVHIEESWVDIKIDGNEFVVEIIADPRKLGILDLDSLDSDVPVSSPRPELGTPSIPPWLKEAGWAQTSGVEEAKPKFLDKMDPEVAESDAPTWLKDMMYELGEELDLSRSESGRETQTQVLLRELMDKYETAKRTYDRLSVPLTDLAKARPSAEREQLAAALAEMQRVENVFERRFGINEGLFGRTFGDLGSGELHGKLSKQKDKLIRMAMDYFGGEIANDQELLEWYTTTRDLKTEDPAMAFQDFFAEFEAGNSMFESEILPQADSKEVAAKRRYKEELDRIELERSEVGAQEDNWGRYASLGNEIKELKEKGWQAFLEKEAPIPATVDSTVAVSSPRTESLTGRDRVVMSLASQMLSLQHDEANLQEAQYDLHRARSVALDNQLTLGGQVVSWDLVPPQSVLRQGEIDYALLMQAYEQGLPPRKDGENQSRLQVPVTTDELKIIEERYLKLKKIEDAKPKPRVPEEHQFAVNATEIIQVADKETEMKLAASDTSNSVFGNTARKLMGVNQTLEALVVSSNPDPGNKFYKYFLDDGKKLAVAAVNPKSTAVEQSKQALDLLALTRSRIDAAMLILNINKLDVEKAMDRLKPGSSSLPRLETGADQPASKMILDANAESISNKKSEKRTELPVKNKNYEATKKENPDTREIWLEKYNNSATRDAVKVVYDKRSGQYVFINISNWKDHPKGKRVYLFSLMADKIKRWKWEEIEDASNENNLTDAIMNALATQLGDDYQRYSERVEDNLPDEVLNRLKTAEIIQPVKREDVRKPKKK